MDPHELWEPVIGLEIHVQLNTKTKLFSSAPNHFGDEPNLNISVADTGQPGALPILNREAVRKAIQFGLAVGGKIAPVSCFDRKSYFYPDTPQNYQITQYTHPLIQGGSIQANGKTFQLHRAHLEEDAGMLKHFTPFSGIDFNRAGAPLLEIVSEPCIHSAHDAKSFAIQVRAIMVYLDASDGNMEEGSFRIDANISVRPKGEQKLRPRVEIKNINSFSFLEMAIASEINRQAALYTTHPDRLATELIPPGTYRWDPQKKQAVLMRAKESADDYRYFPEPDLMPLLLTEEWIDSIRLTLPELPQHRLSRYISDHGLSPQAASLLIQEKALSDYFEAALVFTPHARLLCNWITVEFAGKLKENSLPCSGIPPAHVAKLIQLIVEQRITGPLAKSLAEKMILSPGKDPESIIQNNPDFQPIEDTSVIEEMIDQVLLSHPQSVTDIKAGHEKAFAYLVGQVMKETRGRASPSLVNDLLRKKLSSK